METMKIIFSLLAVSSLMFADSIKGQQYDDMMKAAYEHKTYKKVLVTEKKVEPKIEVVEKTEAPAIESNETNATPAEH